MKDFRELALRGAFWSVVGQGGRQAALIIVSISLARLLSPADFGLVAMALIFVNFAILIGEVGLGSAIIQRSDVTPGQLSSIFWINIAMGAVLAGVFASCAGLIAALFHEPALKAVAIALSPVFIINSGSVVQQALLARKVDFRALAVVDAGSAWASGLISLYLAWTGWGIWSIVAQSLANAAIKSAILWARTTWKPSMHFRWGEIREMAIFSANILASSSLQYWVRNVDNLLIGLFLGPHLLGVYGRAYAVMLFPMQKISRVVSRVMFPAFSRIQEDKARIRATFLRMTRAVALVCFPMMLGVWAAAEPFVSTVFGSHWLEMAPVLRVLCLVGLVQSVTMLVRNLYLSQGRADLQLKVSGVLQTIQVAGIAAGLPWGIEGVAMGYAITAIGSAYPELKAAGRLVGLTPRQFTANLTGIGACASVMAAAITCIEIGLAETAPAARLAVEFAGGLFIYAVLLYLSGSEAIKDVLALARRELAHQPQGARA